MDNRLVGIKKAIERCDGQHPAFEHLIEGELKEMYEDGDINYLVEQAEMFQSLSPHHDEVLGENKRLRQALKFYANERMWTEPTISYHEDNSYEGPPNAIEDSGEIARKALEETK